MSRSPARFDQFLPAQRIPHGTLHFPDPPRRNAGDPFHQLSLRNRSQVVAVDDARLREPFGPSERNLDRNPANRRGYLRRHELVQDGIGVVAAQ